jgi:hypothetical protein
MAFISSTPTTFIEDCNDFLVHDFNPDLTLDLTPMPTYFSADSPTSALTTPTTQASFDDFRSSISSSRSSCSATSALAADQLSPYFDAFVTTPTSPLFDGSLLATSPFLEQRQEVPVLYLNPYDSFNEMPFPPFEYKHMEPIHASLEIPHSPSAISVPMFAHTESYERTITNVNQAARPFQHTLPSFVPSYGSSDDTVNDPPAPAPLPKKPARAAKQDKGIKCDHCGVEKTPLWRKVPNKDNAYHW